MTVALVVVAALLLVPGAGAALALAPPGAITIESRIALAFGLGYGIAAGVATVLALAHVFHLATFVAGIVLVTVGVWAVVLRRAGLRAHAAALRVQAAEAPYVLAGGLLLLLAVLATRIAYPWERTLAIRSAWRYWADGLEVAAAGRVPLETQQWGIEFPTTVSKVVLNSFEGGVSFLLGPDPADPMKAILTMAVVGMAAALLAVGRELGLGAFSSLLPVMIVLVPEFVPLGGAVAGDVRWYTAENMGRLAAFAALVAGIYAVRAADRRAPAMVTGALLAAAGLSHLVPAVVCGGLLALYALGTVLRDRGGLRRLLVPGGLAVGVFVVSYVGILGLSGGDLGFQSAGGAEFEGFPEDVDPTRSLSRGQIIRHPPSDSTFLIPPSKLVRRFAEEAVGNPAWGWIGAGLLATLAAGTVLLVWRRRRFLPLATMTWGLAGALLLAAFFFSYRYDTRIPGDFGARRLYDYVVLIPALLVPAFLAASTGPLLTRSRAAAAVVPLAVGLLGAVAAYDRLPRDREFTAAEQGKQVIELVGDTVPCDARMLSNGRTAGAWEALTGRRAITEGHAVYLRPQVMERVLPILVGANEFWADPQANREFLDELDVDYLVALRPGVWLGTNGHRLPAEGDAEVIATLDDVHQVAENDFVTIFAVGDEAAAAAGGQPRRCQLD